MSSNAAPSRTPLFPSTDEMDAFFLQSDNINVVNIEDPDEEIAELLVAAREDVGKKRQADSVSDGSEQHGPMPPPKRARVEHLPIASETRRSGKVSGSNNAKIALPDDEQSRQAGQPHVNRKQTSGSTAFSAGTLTGWLSNAKRPLKSTASLTSTSNMSRTAASSVSRLTSRTLVTSAGSEALMDKDTSKVSVIGSGSTTSTKADKPKNTRRTSLPKKVDNFDLPLAEYATWIQENYSPSVHGQPFPCQALQGQTVFLAVSDVGKHKAERERLITIRRLGGNVASAYDPDTVTMIATTKTAVDNRSAAKALGLSRLTKVPGEIQIVLWDYMVDCQHAEGDTIPRSCVRHILHEERKPSKPTPAPVAVPPMVNEASSSAGPSRRKRTNKQAVDSDTSDAGMKEPDVKQRKLNRVRSELQSETAASQPAEDPLAALYDEAEAELAQENEFSLRTQSDDMSQKPAEVQLEKGPAKGFACLEDPRETDEESPNQYIIEKLKELKDIYQSKQGEVDHFKVNNLNKVISELTRVKHKITTKAQALALKGSGKKTADKIMEIVETGGLQRIQAEDTEEYRVCKMFAGIYDVGAKRANQWWRMGLRTLEDVEGRKEEIRLTRNQAVGLKYYDDLQERIPRAEASAIFEKIRETAMKIDGNITLYIMGSYRRGEKTVGDIDLLLTRDPTDGITHAGVLNKLLKSLHTKGILMEDLTTPADDGSLEQKYMGLCRLTPQGKARRIDILAIPYDQKGAALIYFTGDDLFNRSIRLLAHKKGYSLNQRGLYGGVVRDPRTKKKTSEGTIIASRTEKEIFDVLGVPWREPHERRRL